MESIIQQFRDIKATMRKNEVWRGVDFDAMLPEGLTMPGDEMPQAKSYQCNIPDLNAKRLTIVNGRCVTPYHREADGIGYGSLRDAMSKAHELTDKMIGKCDKSDNPYEKINLEHFLDGAFIYIPEGVKTAPVFQIMSVTDSERPLFLQTRNLIVCGKGSALTLIQCDDSIGNNRSMSNNVTEMFCEAESRVHHYKLQNMNDNSGLLNHNYVVCGAGCEFQSHVISLNGGHIRNHTEVRLHGEHSDVEVNGLYLTDKEQEVDNYVFVDHASPKCNSHELFKGIIDDAGHATFNGHVLVGEGSVKTEAYQSNRNILLTDKATIQSKPFLEIYNDDVKCSHGSTTGQIDEQAMFYLRSRGISERTARTLMLYAFCDEVIEKIGIVELRERLSDMVKKRLHGELTPCSECALHCSNTCGCNDAPAFEIAPEKL
jgi:Fe-S cluster assembly protein SufD